MISHIKGNKMTKKSTGSILLTAALLTTTLYANQPETAKNFDKVLTLQGITSHVVATNEGSLNQLTIVPTG